MVKAFFTLSKEQKIDFFLKCHKLLLENHPKSHFLFKKSNIKERLQYARDIFENYKGHCYIDDNVAALFNYIKITDVGDPVKALKEHSYKAGVQDYNGISVDWVVFKKLKDCLNFCRAIYNANIKYVLFIKDGKPKIYETLGLMSKILNMPMV